MTRSLLFCGLVGLSLASAGCAEDTTGSPEEAAAEQDFVSKGGVSLSAPGDKDLQISLLMLDGVKAKTKNKRFIKATVTRKGKSFGAFCSLRGQIVSSEQRAIVSCAIDVATVSNDDDESLGFEIMMTRTRGQDLFVLRRADYSGDGTFLGKEAAILGHTDDTTDLELSAREAKNENKNVFLLARTLLDAASPLLSEKVKSEDVDAPVAVSAVEVSLADTMTLQTSLALGRTGRLHAAADEVSVLSTPGDLSKGLLAAPALTAKLKAALPR